MIVEILRHRKGDSNSYYQKFEYKCADEKETVATMLNNLNLNNELKDIDGNIVDKIVRVDIRLSENHSLPCSSYPQDWLQG